MNNTIRPNFVLLKKELTGPVNNTRDPYKKRKHVFAFLINVIQTCTQTSSTTLELFAIQTSLTTT